MTHPTDAAIAQAWAELFGSPGSDPLFDRFMRRARELDAQQREHIHTCSYYCDRPECLKAQRDELRERLEAMDSAKGGEAKVNAWEQVADDAVQACWQAYQAVGVMLSDLGIFNTERGGAILDNLSQARPLHEILPWQSTTPPTQPGDAVERVAESLWVSAPTKHRLLEKAGYAIDWASQPTIIKRDYHKQARAAIAAMQAGE